MPEKKFFISEEELEYILGSEYQSFKDMILTNVRCVACSPDYSTTIVDYTIEANDINDLIFKGKCAKCDNKVVRYSETGETLEYAEMIENIRKKRATKN